MCQNYAPSFERHDCALCNFLEPCMAPGRPYKLFDSWFEFVRLLKRTTIHPSDPKMESFNGWWDGPLHDYSPWPKNWTLLTSFQQRSTNAWKGPISLGFIGAFGFIRLCSTQAFRQFDFYLHKASRNAFYAIISNQEEEYALFRNCILHTLSPLLLQAQITSTRTTQIKLGGKDQVRSPVVILLQLKWSMNWGIWNWNYILWVLFDVSSCEWRVPKLNGAKTV